MQSLQSQDFSISGFAEALTPYLRSNDDDSSNDVYVGIVVQPGGLSRTHAYVKIFPKSDTELLVLNEVIAHSIAAQCEIPSSLTFPCACAKSLLRQSTPAMLGRNDGSTHVLAVASVDGNPKRIRQLFEDSQAAWADIMNWPQVARAAVYDELIGNGDRHVRNLVRCGLSDYVLIDHEHFLFDENWLVSNVDHLRTRRCDANALADSIAEGTDEVVRQRMIKLAQNYVLQKYFTAPINAQGLETLCHVQHGTIAQMVDILNARRLILPSLMQWHLEKGQLFRVGSFK